MILVEAHICLPERGLDTHMMMIGLAPFTGYNILARPNVIDPVIYNTHPPYYGAPGWRLPILGAPLVVVPPPAVEALPGGGK